MKKVIKRQDGSPVTHADVEARFSQKKTRNDENIQQVVDVLTAARYQQGRTIRSMNGDMEFWVGPGRIPVIVLHLYDSDDGFEVYIPITQSNRMDETLAALKDVASKVKEGDNPVSAVPQTSQSA